MNNLRGIFSKVASSIPKGGAGGAAGGGPSIPAGAGAGVTVLAVLGLGSYAAYHSVVTVQPGHKGVVYNRFNGLDDKHHLNEGINFVLPWFQRPIVFDVRTRPQPIDTTSGSKGEGTDCCSFLLHNIQNKSSNKSIETAFTDYIAPQNVIFFRLANGYNFASCFVQTQPQ